MTQRDEINFTPEQMEVIRTELDKLKERYTRIAREKTMAREAAGRISDADLAFGKRLQEELYNRPRGVRPTETSRPDLYLGYQRIGMGTPMKGNVRVGEARVLPPRVKKPALWKRLAHRLARKAKVT